MSVPCRLCQFPMPPIDGYHGLCASCLITYGLVLPRNWDAPAPEPAAADPEPRDLSGEFLAEVTAPIPPACVSVLDGAELARNVDAVFGRATR